MNGRGHPTMDNAAVAIAGMPPHASADKLEQMEMTYQVFLARFRKYAIMAYQAKPMITYLREMLAAATWELSDALINLEAAKIQTYNDKDRMRWAKQLADLSKLVEDNWPNDHRLAVQRNTPILELVQTLLLEYRMGVRK